MKHFLIFFALCLHTLRADLSLLKLNAYSNWLQSEENFVDPILEPCRKVLNKFADTSANFTRCSIKYARPIRLCELCLNDYVQFDTAYKELLNTTVDGISCESFFVSHDRLEAVSEYYNNMMDIWDKGHCKNCFDWSSVTPVLSNMTVRFNKMFKDTTDCIVKYYNSSANNSEAVCAACMQFYLSLDEYYKTLSYDAIGVDSMCMDIVDKMNATRFVWSKTLNCCKLRRTPEIIFLVCTGIISFLPVFFYLAVRFCGPIRDLPNVLRQSRFKQSLLRSVEGNIR